MPAKRRYHDCILHERTLLTQVFGSPGVAAPDDDAGGEVAWDILYAAVDKTAARTQVTQPPMSILCCHVQLHAGTMLYIDHA